MWGIVPAAGQGSRMQPLAFSKELLPVGSRRDGEWERPRAVSEYLVERLILGGADKLCFVIAPGKSDIMEYYGGRVFSADVFYAVQPHASGLCDAIFRALPLVGADEHVLVGLPDTIWFPEDALSLLPDEGLSFLLFPVDRPQLFDAVVLDHSGRVEEIQVKRQDAASNWVWGAFKMAEPTFRELHRLWLARGQQDEYVGTLVNAWIGQGGTATAVRRGRSYVDVGTVRGYRDAVMLLSGMIRTPGMPADAAWADPTPATGAT
jgi:glucose-1-phosphate thymidylyltransferase